MATSASNGKLSSKRQCTASTTLASLLSFRCGAGGMAERDESLSFSWQTDAAALSFLGGAAFNKTIRSICTEAYLTCRDDPERWISYSRRKAFYKRTRYRHTTYT